MGASLPIFRRLTDALRGRDWFGIAFELFVVALGVVLGLEASRWAEAREERAYRQQMITALDQTLRNYALNGRQIRKHITDALDEHADKTRGGGRAAPPFMHITGLDRPPTKTWDALTATGIARSLDPELVLNLAIFFSRADAFGDQYHRYNDFTEREVLPFVSDSRKFYGPGGRLLPQYAAHIDRLRDLRTSNDQLIAEGVALRRALARDP